MEQKTDFWSRFYNAKKNMDKDDIKQVKGYNSSYTPLEAIRKVVEPALAAENITIGPESWKVNSLTDETYTREEKGRDIVTHGTMIFTLIDLKTDLQYPFNRPAEGKGVDGGQSLNSAATYAWRGWLKQTFAIDVDSLEEEISFDTKWVGDVNGEASEKITDANLKQVKALIFIGVESQEEAIEKNKKVLSKLNETLGAKDKYKKLSIIPNKYVEEVIKVISVMNNA